MGVAWVMLVEQIRAKSSEGQHMAWFAGKVLTLKAMVAARMPASPS